MNDDASDDVRNYICASDDVNNDVGDYVNANDDVSDKWWWCLWQKV